MPFRRSSAGGLLPIRYGSVENIFYQLIHDFRNQRRFDFLQQFAALVGGESRKSFVEVQGRVDSVGEPYPYGDRQVIEYCVLIPEMAAGVDA